MKARSPVPSGLDPPVMRDARAECAIAVVFVEGGTEL